MQPTVLEAGDWISLSAMEMLKKGFSPTQVLQIICYRFKMLNEESKIKTTACESPNVMVLVSSPS